MLLEKINIVPPTFQGTLSVAGAFTIPLQKLDDAALIPLPCESKTDQLGFVSLVVVSSTPQPTQSSEVSGVYTLGPTASMTTDAWWIYSANDFELDTTCTLPESSPVAVKLKLVPGWNQVILTSGEGARFESGPVPVSFVWSQF